MDIDLLIDKLLQGDSEDLVLIGGDHQIEMGEISKSISELIIRDQASVGDSLSSVCDRIDEFSAGLQCRGYDQIVLFKRHQLRKHANEYRLIIDAVDQTVTALKLQEAQLLKDNALLKGFHSRLDILSKYLEQDIEIANSIHTAVNEKKNEYTSCRYPDVCDALERLTRRTESLVLSQITTHQMLLQIELLQANNRKLIDLIVETVSCTIPLWRNRLSLAVGLSTGKSMRSISGKKRMILIGEHSSSSTGVINGLETVDSLSEIDDASRHLRVALVFLKENEQNRKKAFTGVATALHD